MDSITLEEILQKYFGCKKPFLKKRKVVGSWYDGEVDYEYFTVAGGKAYSKLINLVEDLELLTGSGESHHTISILDEIVTEEN